MASKPLSQLTLLQYRVIDQNVIKSEIILTSSFDKLVVIAAYKLSHKRNVAFCFFKFKRDCNNIFYS